MPRCHQIVFLRNTRPDQIAKSLKTEVGQQEACRGSLVDPTYRRSVGCVRLYLSSNDAHGHSLVLLNQFRREHVLFKVFTQLLSRGCRAGVPDVFRASCRSQNTRPELGGIHVLQHFKCVRVYCLRDQRDHVLRPSPREFEATWICSSLSHYAWL